MHAPCKHTHREHTQILSLSSLQTRARVLSFFFFLIVAPFFSRSGRSRGSYSPLVNLASHCVCQSPPLLELLLRAADARSAGTAAKVMTSGQQCPASGWFSMYLL